mgnify:CR=1 FL=1
MNEQDVKDYLLQHKEGLEDEIRKNVKECSDLFPPSLYNIYLEQYRDKALEIIKENVGQSFNLTPEELHLILTEKFVIMTLGDKILCP